LLFVTIGRIETEMTGLRDAEIDILSLRLR